MEAETLAFKLLEEGGRSQGRYSVAVDVRTERGEVLYRVRVDAERVETDKPQASPAR